MTCAWNELLAILPHSICQEVDRLGRDHMEELRLRMNAPPEVHIGDRHICLKGIIRREDLEHVINAASRYSPWSAASTAQGYLSISGGHRIGICGEVVIKDGAVTGFRSLRSLCIRVARDYSGIVKEPDTLHGSVLIIGAPGWGKTTLLRDLIRQISQTLTVGVVDERGELFPPGFQEGKRMDVLTGCPKTVGIEMLLRTMGPEYIAVDEITAEEDCQALVKAANCGVSLLATVHGAAASDLLQRKIYQPLIQQNIVDTLLVLRRDKSYVTERMTA